MIPEISGPIFLKDKVAIVTGASGGIGKAIAKSLSKAGAYVGMIDLKSCDNTLNSLKHKDRAISFECDISDTMATEKAISSIVSEWNKIDILINNASIVGSSGKELEEFSVDEWETLLKINLGGTFLITKHVWPFMKQAGKGKVVCIGSIAGKIGGIFAGPHYCASKGGIHAFVKWAAKNGAKHGIHVNGIAPGPIVTSMTANEPLIKNEMIPLGRLGQPEDIAEAAMFLSSQASNFITGCVLDVNGGLLMA